MVLAELDPAVNTTESVSLCRNAYALAAGFALGLIRLGSGKLSPPMETKLYGFIRGTERRSDMSKYTGSASTVWHSLESDRCNPDVSVVPATLALGLIFFNTNNSVVANWLQPPRTGFALSELTPKMLLARTIGYCLINWRKVKPDCAALEQLRAERSKYRHPTSGCSEWPEDLFAGGHIHVETGYLYALGLKYAGSGDVRARDVIVRKITAFLFTLHCSSPSPIVRSALTDSVATLGVSLALVMAGTGDLEALRVLRALSLDETWTATYGYGLHTPVSMALGMLFMGGCSLTFGCRPVDTALLLISTYPIWSFDSTSNKDYLQVWRHLYVVAVDRRFLYCQDLVTSYIQHADITVTLRHSNITHTLKAPAVLPAWHKIQTITISANGYQTLRVTAAKDGLMARLRRRCRRGLPINLQPTASKHRDDLVELFSHADNRFYNLVQFITTFCLETDQLPLLNVYLSFIETAHEHRQGAGVATSDKQQLWYLCKPCNLLTAYCAKKDEHKRLIHALKHLLSI